MALRCEIINRGIRKIDQPHLQIVLDYPVYKLLL